MCFVYYCYHCDLLFFFFFAYAFFLSLCFVKAKCLNLSFQIHTLSYLLLLVASFIISQSMFLRSGLFLFSCTKVNGTFLALCRLRTLLTLPLHPLSLLPSKYFIRIPLSDLFQVSFFFLFCQIPLDAKSREITAFSTPSGHYEWLRLPMGLRNAPLTFQRMVNYLFSGLIGNGMFCYLDDLIIVSKDLESHLHKLDLVFTKLEEAGLQTKLSKCDFLKSRIEFLGHAVDGEGIHTVDSKINAVKHFPTPQNVENVRSFLGLAGYSRAFVRNFASIASPLTRLIKKDVLFIWHDDQRQAFESLKHALTHTPVLAFPDYKKPFIL